MRTPLEMRFCVSLPESGQRPATSATYRRVGDGTAHRATGGRGRGRSTTGPGREKRDCERGRCGVRGLLSNKPGVVRTERLQGTRNHLPDDSQEGYGPSGRGLRPTTSRNKVCLTTAVPP